MAHPLLLALALLITLRDAVGPYGRPPGPATAAVYTLVPLAVAWLTTHAIVRHAGRAIDRTGSRVALHRAESAARALSTLLIVQSLLAFFWFDWLGAVRSVTGDLVWVDEALASAPFIAVLVAGWWTWAPIERRLIDATLIRALDQGDPIHPPPTPAQLVTDRFRHSLAIGLVVISLILAWAELTFRLGATAAERGWFRSSEEAQAATAVAQFTVSIPVLLLAPVLIRVFWDTVPLPPGDLLSRVTALCARHRVRFRRALVWRTRGSMLNGAVVGVVAPLRYILLTDALIERLPDHELDAVIAHEVAHVRFRHLPWLLGSTGVAAMLAGTAVSLAGRVPGANLGPVLSDTAAIGASVLAGVMVFGLVSRRFERQADAFAARDGSVAAGSATVTPLAAEAMAAALERVARLNHVPTGRFGFRHGSIAGRARRVRALAGIPTQAVPVDRLVRRIKAATLAGGALTLLTVVLA